MDREAALRSFHARHAGSSPIVFGTGGPGPGESYRRLADAVDAGPVLDLGCGDGSLLELVAARGFEVCGLDMSPEELALASERLGPGVRLELARADATPFDDGAFATVVSHMAFMLMQPLDEVVREIARLLPAGGRFVATVGCRQPPSAAESLFWAKYDELTADLAPLPTFGDPRVVSREGLAELFSGPAWAELADEEFPIVVHVPADELREWFHVLTYQIDMLPETTLHALQDWVHADRDRLAPDGTMTWTFRARQFSVLRV